MKNTRMSLPAWRASRKPKITQRQVALLAGLSPSRYWQVESGEGSEPGADEKSAIAKVLGVKVSEIEWPEVLKARTA